jgi:hypothetical protein
MEVGLNESVGKLISISLVENLPVVAILVFLLEQLATTLIVSFDFTEAMLHGIFFDYLFTREKIFEGQQIRTISYDSSEQLASLAHLDGKLWVGLARDHILLLLFFFHLHLHSSDVRKTLVIK